MLFSWSKFSTDFCHWNHCTLICLTFISILALLDCAIKHAHCGMYYCTIYIRSRSQKEPHILQLSCIFNKIENSLLLESFLLLFSQVSFPSGYPTVFFTVLVFTTIPLMLGILQWVSVKFHSFMCSVTEFRKTLNSTACEGSHIFFTGSYANTK